MGRCTNAREPSNRARASREPESIHWRLNDARVGISHTLSRVDIRIGYGEDAHRLEVGRRLILAGLEVANAPHGAVAHSDGDAVLHAVADALLSALALGDIGKLYPDTDPRWQGLDSSVILGDCCAQVRGAGWRIVNVAVVVTLDKPKLGALRDAMAQNLARLLEVEDGDVGIGFKTSEGLATAHVQTRATILLSRM
jgi:2-C-methyl-D-erythritol 2,4-cyclodiphosphate synthase